MKPVNQTALLIFGGGIGLFIIMYFILFIYLPDQEIERNQEAQKVLDRMAENITNQDKKDYTLTFAMKVEAESGLRFALANQLRWEYKLHSCLISYSPTQSGWACPDPTVAEFFSELSEIIDEYELTDRFCRYNPDKCNLSISDIIEMTKLYPGLLTDDEIDILISKAVGNEYGFTDKEIDYEASKIIQKMWEELK